MPPDGSTNKNKTTSGLSKKNRNIVIGCCVGIGVPLLLLILLFLYHYCIKPKQTNFIDSDGKVITAYKTNNLQRFFNSLIGKNKNTEQYQTKSPLGNTIVTSMNNNKIQNNDVTANTNDGDYMVTNGGYNFDNDDLIIQRNLRNDSGSIFTTTGESDAISSNLSNHDSHISLDTNDIGQQQSVFGSQFVEDFNDHVRPNTGLNIANP